MASTLTDRLSRLVKTMRGQARITESNVQDMSSQPSSLPTKQARASLCARICATVPRASVEYRGTET